MPAPNTPDEFLGLVRKSGVADEARLVAYLKRLADGGGVPADPGGLAAALVRDGVLTYFQADQLLQGKWKRFFIGKYKVLERLGTGGMGQVFLCEHKMMRRRVAVKVLPAAKASDPAALDRFYREARAVAALDHPNIVRAYDIDQDDSLHFLVMEWVDGTNLQDLVRKVGPLDPVRAAHYVYGTAVGLQHAHEMGLVHRDIKPGNVLVDRSGVVKILDMGLARFFSPEEDDLLTKKYDENILGTADYLAPEQAVDSTAVDIRADLYALGGTFYFLLTGRPVFPEGSVPQKLLWHQTREPTPVIALRPDVPPEMSAIVTRLMAKRPEDRFQTPAEVMAALAPWARAPIPPPSDREMPTFSLAAVGPGSGGPLTAKALTDFSTVVTQPQAPPVSPSSAATAVRPSGPGLGAPAAATQTRPAGPAQSAVAPAVDPAAAWEAITSETQAVSKADTDRSPKANRRVPAPARSEGGRRLVPYLALGAVLLLGVTAAGAAGAYFLFFGKSDVVHGDAKVWYVAASGSSPNPDRTLTTLRGALERAGAGDTVVLLDDRIEDSPIRLADTGAGKKKGLRIEAGNAAKLVTWAPRVSAAQAAAALQLIGVEGLHLSGLVVDLGGSAHYGLAVSGACPGLTAEGVTVRNPAKGGVWLSGAAGQPDRPVTVRGLRVAGDKPYDAGVLVQGGQHLLVADARVDGPAAAGVRVEGAVTEAAVRDSRFNDLDHGVLLAGALKPGAAFGLTVAGNTFHAIKAAGVKSDHPLGGPQQRLELVDNYFAATKEVATSSGPVPGLKAAGNARDRATKEGKVPTGSAEVAAAVPADPADDATFLKPAGAPKK